MANYRESKKPALRLAGLVDAGKMSLPGVPENLAFDYVDYEIHPCRTTRREEPAGIGDGPARDHSDLLLANKVDKLPIIAAVKAPGDTLPFLALIQKIERFRSI